MGGVLLIAPLSLLSFHMIYVFLKFVFLNYHSVCQRYRTVSPFGGNPTPLPSLAFLASHARKQSSEMVLLIKKKESSRCAGKYFRFMPSRWG